MLGRSKQYNGSLKLRLILGIFANDISLSTVTQEKGLFISFGQAHYISRNIICK